MAIANAVAIAVIDDGRTIWLGKVRKNAEGELTHNHPDYRIWVSLRHNCNSKRSSISKVYHDKGITYDETWDDFWKFISDVGRRPSLQNRLIRIDPAGPYCASNCEWREGSPNRNCVQDILLQLVILEPNSMETGCWEWSGRRDEKGYGRVDYIGKNCMVHRLVYEMFVAKIPSELTIDHLCRNKTCANFNHMEVVTSEENSRRGHAARTHCTHGHALTPENTVIRYRSNRTSHERICLECDRGRKKRWEDRRRQNRSGGNK